VKYSNLGEKILVKNKNEKQTKMKKNEKKIEKKKQIDFFYFMN
jgi:hypothetical protein